MAVTTWLNWEAMRSQNPDAEVDGLYRGQGSTIHLYSDGALPDAAEVLPANIDTIVYHAIGTADAANAGITSVRSHVRRS